MTESISTPQPIRRRPWVRWLLLIGWMAAIFFVSGQPQLPQIPTSWVDLVVKKLAHATAYAILFGLWFDALDTNAGTAKNRVPLALMLTFGYAISDEWHQTFVPGRHGQVWDVLIDSTGALIFLAVIWRTRRAKEGNQ